VSKDLVKDHAVASHIEDPFLRRSVKTALHLRRYMPFYVFGSIWIVTLAIFPSIHDNGKSTVATSGVTGVQTNSTGTPSDQATVTTAADTGGTAAATAGTGTGGTGAKSTAARPGTAAAAPTVSNTSKPISAEQAAQAIQRGVGKTRLGADCSANVRQVPLSTYALPCQNVYTGPNGGGTFRGVTDKEISIWRRKFPDSANTKAVDAVNQQAGYASSDVTEAVRQEFVKFFNKSYELYGRQVNYQTYTSENGDSTNEAQSKGKEGACLDADKMVKELKAFGVLGGSSPFSECAAERQMFVFTAGAYYPESWYRKYNPYLWGTVMECERISYQVSEYIGKRLLNRPAKWAGDAVTQKKTRYFGTYVPDNDGYQQCVGITKNELKTKYGVSDTGPQYNYQLDISRFPDQAAQAAVQFSAAGVTTVILACDYISATVLTAAAQRQNWHPEWMTIGTGGTDLDNSARLYDQTQVNGHLFGPSQLGATEKLIGPNSEPGKVYKLATGKQIPDGTSGDYFTLVHIYNLLQAAGPVLNGDNIARGAMTIPGGGGAPDYAAGYWSLLDGPNGTVGAGDHTVVDDSREVYWVCQVSGDGTACQGSASDGYYNGSDGKNGVYKEAQGGKRFRNGEWTRDEPPIYPAR
jgi:hypothetical protein